VLNYTSSDLAVTFTGTFTGTITLTIITGTNPTANLITTITPTFFEHIKHPTMPIQWSSNNSAIVSVDGNGMVEGKQA
jgi:hypothetical protein